LQNQTQVADISVLSADSHQASCPAVSVAEACRSTNEMFAVTWSGPVVTSYTTADTLPLTSSQPRVTLSELQPAQPVPVTTNMSSDLKTCFATPSATAVLASDGSYRTTYGPMQISAQVLTLPRSITNCRNLSRPLTLSYAGRQVIVPPSCIVLGAEGAKLLLPPQTIVPNKPLPDPLNLSSDGMHSISSTADVFLDNTAELTPSKSGSASETASSEKAESLLPHSTDREDEPATEPLTITTVPLTQSTSETHYPTDQQVSLDKEQTFSTDQCQELDINRLNDRSLVHIFTFLRLTELLRMSCVCSRWNAAARDPVLVNHIYNSPAYCYCGLIGLRLEPKAAFLD